MPDRPTTTFLQSPADFPSPEPGFWPVQTPIDGPQPAEDLFAQALQSGEIPILRSDPKWVTNLVTLRRREDRERLRFREKADTAWDRYNNIYDFSDKEAWQSRKVPPKVYIAVERLAALIYGVLERSREFFDLETLDEASEVYFNLVKNLILWFLEHDTVNFKKEFRKALRSGLLWQQMYMLVCWEDGGELQLNGNALPDMPIASEADSVDPISDAFQVGLTSSTVSQDGIIMPSKHTPRLKMVVLNPDYVWLDHSGRNRYVIWDVHYTRGEARRQAEKSNWDMDAVERGLMKPMSATTTTDNVAPYQASRDAQKQERIPDFKTYQNAKVTYFFGDYFDETTGELLMENCYFVVLNDAELVVPPQKNPFWDGELPIVSAPITEVPFAAYGKSPIVQNLDMFDLYVDTLNLMADYIQAILLGMKEVDLDVIDDYDEDYRSGFFPGKVIKKRGGGNPQVQAVNHIPMSDLPPGVWQAWQVYQRETQDNVMITDAIGGQARTRGRVTAMEFNRRAADAGELINFVFFSLQDNFLQPAIRRAFHCILQYMPQKMWANWIENNKGRLAPGKPELVEKWKAAYEDMKTWTPEQRWHNLAGFFRNKVRCLSGLADKQMEIEKSTFFAQTASQIPGMAPHVNWIKLGKNICKAFEWDPEEMIMLEAQPLPRGAAQFVDPSAEGPEETAVTPPGPPIQPGGFNLGAPQSLSTSPPFAPGAGGPGMPP